MGRGPPQVLPQGARPGRPGGKQFRRGSLSKGRQAEQRVRELISIRETGRGRQSEGGRESKQAPAAPAPPPAAAAPPGPPPPAQALRSGSAPAAAGLPGGRWPGGAAGRAAGGAERELGWLLLTFWGWRRPCLLLGVTWAARAPPRARARSCLLARPGPTSPNTTPPHKRHPLAALAAPPPPPPPPPSPPRGATRTTHLGRRGRRQCLQQLGLGARRLALQPGAVLLLRLQLGRGLAGGPGGRGAGPGSGVRREGLLSDPK